MKAAPRTDAGGAPGSLIEAQVPRWDVRTSQQVAVDAGASTTYGAIWRANLLATPLARVLSGVAMGPERVAARMRGQRPLPARSSRAVLADLLTDSSPWVMLGETAAHVRQGYPTVSGLRRGGAA